MPLFSRAPPVIPSTVAASWTPNTASAEGVFSEKREYLWRLPEHVEQFLLGGIPVPSYHCQFVCDETMWGAEEVDTVTRTSTHHRILGPEVHISLVPPFLCDGELPGGLRVWRIIKLGVNLKCWNQGTWIKLTFINSNKRWYLCHAAIVPAQDI